MTGEKTPNDPKLSDRGVRRGTCMVGGKAATEAGAVTHGAVRCSAWLGAWVIWNRCFGPARNEPRKRTCADKEQQPERQSSRRGNESGSEVLFGVNCIAHDHNSVSRGAGEVKRSSAGLAAHQSTVPEKKFGCRKRSANKEAKPKDA